MATFYDTHAHLDYPDFSNDLPQVLERAAAAGIEKMIAIGTDLESSRRAIQLTEQFANVFAVVGWHPSYVTSAPDDFRATLLELASHSKVVGLGETGLDYHRLPSQKPGSDEHEDPIYKLKQAELFRQHLEVGAELNLNCVIHQRDALEDILAQFKPFADKVRGVFHCFANDVETMRRIVNLNSIVSFTGILTFKNGQNIRETLSATPMGKFMLETDCPFLAPVPYRGKRCEPAYVQEIAVVASQVKNCSLGELSEATCQTARAFFRGLT